MKNDKFSQVEETENDEDRERKWYRQKKRLNKSEIDGDPYLGTGNLAFPGPWN